MGCPELPIEYYFRKSAYGDFSESPKNHLYGNFHRATIGKDGKLAETENPLGEKTEFDYNEFGKLAGRSGAGGYDLSYIYTPFGEIASYTDGNGAKTSFKYDDSGKLVSRIWADGSAIKYDYNDNGLLAKKTEADRVAVYTYDSMNSLESISVHQESEKAETKPVYNSDSKLARISDGNGVVEFKYDAFDRITSEKGSIGEIKYGYNSAGQLSAKTCMLDEKEFKTEYFYDDLNRVVKVTSPAGEYVYSYDTKGRIASLSFGSVKINNDYDKAVHLSSKKMNDTILCSYEYDKLDRRVKATVNEVTWLYKYDEKGQLLSAVSRDGNSYGYSFDPIGNILSDEAHKYAFNNLNQIVRADVSEKQMAFEYDKYGNLVKNNEAEFKYDLNNRLTEVRKANVYVKYEYDPLGQRIKITETTSKGTRNTKFLMSEMFEQARISDDMVQFHTLGLDLSGSLTVTGGISAILASTSDNDNFNYLYDGNGNVIGACDGKGTISKMLIYSPFGNKISGSDLPFEFSTKPVDMAGNTYYGFRFYNSNLGRWMSRDPFGEEGKCPNLYVFVGNSSIQYIDNRGLMTGTFEPNKNGEYYREWQPTGGAMGTTHPSQSTECICKCNAEASKNAGHKVYELSCNFSVLYSIMIASDVSPVWNDTPASFPSDPTPDNWATLPLAEKIRLTKKHEQIHVANFKSWYEGRKAIIIQAEQAYYTEGMCNDKKTTITQDNDSTFKKKYADETNHVGW